MMRAKIGLIILLLFIAGGFAHALQPQTPDHIVFISQPSHTVAGESISPAIQVEVRDADGIVLPWYSDEISLSIQNNAGGGTLSGTFIVNAHQGMATFNDISIDKAAEGYTLQAQSAGLPSVESEAFNITAAHPAEIIKISGDNQSGSVETPLQNPFVVELRDEFDNRVPDFDVEFSISSQPENAGAALSSTTARTDSDGQASSILTMGNKAGTYTVDASAADVSAITFTATISAYTISGNISKDGTALPGVTITAAGGHDQTVTSSVNGSYTLTNVPHGAPDISITPSLTGHSFSPASITMDGPITENIIGVNFNAELLTYTVSGTITKDGSGLADATVTASGGHSQTVTTNSNGDYTLTDVPFGTTDITITPELTGHEFSPPTRTIDGPVTDNISDQDFIASLLTFTISGTITKDGTGLENAAVTASGDYNQSVTTNSNGEFTFTDVKYGTTNITITPALEGHDFSPPSITVAEPVTDDITGVDFTATLKTYSISGTVSGDTQGDVTITISGDYSATAQTPSNGNFNITGIPHGSSISITPAKEGFSFHPESRSISNVTSDQTGQNFTAIRWRLIFGQQPTNTQAGEPISPAVTVIVIDHNDNIVTSFTGRITIILHDNPSNGVLTGTTQVNAVDGVATFSDLRIEKVGEDYTLRATSIGFEQRISDAFNITPGDPSQLEIISGDEQDGVMNSELANPLVVGVSDQFGNVVPGVTVSFTITSQPENAGGSLSNDTGISDEGGRTSTRLTLGDRAGEYLVRASTAGAEPVTFTALLQGFNISGSIDENGDKLPDVTVTASDGYEQTTTTDAEGKFVITGVPRGAENIRITPTREGYGFIPATILITGPVHNNIEDIDFSATQFTYTLSGRVHHNNAGLQDVEITAEGGHIATVKTNNQGEYVFQDVAHGADNIVITPDKTGYMFNPLEIIIVGPVSDNIRLDDFSAHIQTFSISGRITHNDQGLQDVTVTASGNYNNTVQTGSDGRYEFDDVLYGESDITITPEKPGYLFDPENTAISEPVVTDVVDLDFATTPPPAPSLSQPENDADDQRITPTLSWQEVPGALSYGLEVSNDESFSGEPVLSVTDIQSTSYTVQDLERGQVYYWRVNAANHGGTSPWSDAWRFTTTTSMKSISIVSSLEGGVWKENDTVEIRWESQEIENITLEYSTDNGSTWNIIAGSVHAGEEHYLWSVPGISSLYCRIKISDASDETYYALSGIFSIYPAIVPMQHSLTFGDAGSISSYRLIGLPGKNDLPLSDVLPGTPDKDWTGYFDNGTAENYLIKYDGSARFSFTPGKGFWILSKNGFSIQDEVESVDLAPDHTYHVQLHNGWNIISNPFDLPVLWDAVKAANNITESLWDFNGQYNPGEVLEPYKGYYFYNGTGLTSLKIPFPDSNQNFNLPGEGTSVIKTITISLKQDNKKFNPVYAHVVDKKFKDHIKYAPPGDFNEISITLENDTLSTPHSRLVEDAREQNNDGYIFTIDIVSRTSKPADLIIQDLDLFEGYTTALVDKNTGKQYDIRDGVVENIVTGSTKRTFNLVIGSVGFIEKMQNTLLPKEFHLSNNYPNPFNPVTTIEYSIPTGYDRIPTTLEVYNVLGQRVRVLVDEMQDAGFYTVQWNGKNDAGQTVSSGLYIYVLRAGTFIDRNRMMFIK